MDDEPSLNESTENLLGPNQPDDDDETYFRGARESQRRRIQNSKDGAHMLSELRRRGYTLREIEQRTGISKSNIRRWATPPTPPKATP